MSRPNVSFMALCGALLISGMDAARAACQFEPQGEGRVAAIVDGRSFRMTDGREVRLAGIESGDDASSRPGRMAALEALIRGRDVMLRGQDDTPDRYGRQIALVFLDDSDIPLQVLLLGQGQALVSAEIADRDCAALLAGAEDEARKEKRGLWADPSAIKNAESSDDILSGIGRFSVIEGVVLSVRQAGTTTYLNFGRNWTRGFAATISKRVTTALEAAGIAVKSLENRRIRIRGWVEGRPGPRVEIARVGQIEILAGY